MSVLGFIMGETEAAPGVLEQPPEASAHVQRRHEHREFSIPEQSLITPSALTCDRLRETNIAAPVPRSDSEPANVHGPDRATPRDRLPVLVRCRRGAARG